MALIEINLEKPAIIEERPGAAGSAERSRTAGGRTGSGGGKAKLVGLLAVLFGLGLLVTKLRGRGGTEVEAGAEVEPMEESTGSGGGMGKVAGALGLVVALVGVLAAARKRRR